MKDKPLGHVETYKQSIDGKDFLIHCQKDDRYVTKIMSTHGLLTAVETIQLIASLMEVEKLPLD